MAVQDQTLDKRSRETVFATDPGRYFASSDRGPCYLFSYNGILFRGATLNKLEGYELSGNELICVIKSHGSSLLSLLQVQVWHDGYR